MLSVVTAKPVDALSRNSWSVHLLATWTVYWMCNASLSAKNR